MRHYRVSAGLSQEALAERAGLSVRGISDLERGARTFPRLETVRMLADALELDERDRAVLLGAARPELTVDDPDPVKPSKPERTVTHVGVVFGTTPDVAHPLDRLGRQCGCQLAVEFERERRITGRDGQLVEQCPRVRRRVGDAIARRLQVSQ